ncbi:SDR family oxidoreductase [Bizionia argentinensis JUB59]|uniref:SDR family oxidoreductase n=1 Tax=Bizionia argentinensis JUB59 TaxID=1046627 RepID=G2EGE1_9FLAO|nr:SDR family oxidoreductase [Bizionia argentinensis]EGV42523.1 SDR family oxidoreductase [Bizionia argentinensis JUB59]
MKVQKNLIVITGGAGGIGQACARAFKNQPIILTDYSQDKVDETVAKFSKEGFDVAGIACDITDKKGIDKLTKFVADNGSLKAFIHTAGVSGTVKDLKKVFNIDLVATDLLVDAFYELAEKDSVAILLSSMMAHTVPANKDYDEALINPQAQESFDIVSKFVNNDSDLMYNFAKRGVQLLTIKNANKWGEKGARIVSVSPGVIETPMALKAAEEHPERMEMIKQATPLKRNGQPKDVVDVIHFLASDAARFINSTDILIDGGVIHNIKKMG